MTKNTFLKGLKTQAKSVSQILEKEYHCQLIKLEPLVKKALGLWTIQLVQETAKLIFVFAKWLALTLVLAILSLPYEIWRSFIPDRNGSQPASRFFRKAFETKRAKQVLGVNLAAMVLVTSVFQGSLPTLATEPDQVEVLPEPEEVITTETTLRLPVGGYISQGYHWYHQAVDIAGNDNLIIYPLANGTVTNVEYGRFGYGNSVIVVHDNQLVSRYAHLSLIKVQVGESVEKNTALGYVGSTGWSTGNHLHLEIYENGQAINPLTVMPSYFEE